LLGCLLYILETFVLFSSSTATTSTSKNQKEEEQPTAVMKELAESIQGLYLIFVPFIPCLLWSLIVLVVPQRESSHPCTSPATTTMAKKEKTQ